ncbi:MAG: hypothetical protein AVDCRST_MAG45-262, partial [uncultured Solirubrobacterales bacterium]
ARAAEASQCRDAAFLDRHADHHHHLRDHLRGDRRREAL